VPIEQPMICFTLGDQRFAIQWTVAELSAGTGGSNFNP
jgi:hypothetical protein